ncbi:hypothetical protein [Clostridium sp.]|uniref:hypothetical protein n=1 Tax=Clostridium sp. TaxID=1506 RepID=UPI003464D9F9
MNSPLDDLDIIHKLSVVTAHYAYRNGPIEDMHSDGKLSENDMKELNKFVVNKLAYIFTLILDKDKLSKIRAYCRYKDVDIKLTYATMIYVFKDGIMNKKIIIENLNENDIEELYEFMQRKLAVVFNLILEKNNEMIKKFLVMGIFYCQDWDCAIPESIDFESFLHILSNV